MALLVEQILSIVTFFLTVKSMVRAWWKAKTVRYSEPLQASPIESALMSNLVLPVQLDSLSIRSVGVPPRDRGSKQEPLIPRPFEKEPDTRTNGLIDLLFVKSSSDDNLYTGRHNDNVGNGDEARVDVVGCSEGTCGVRQENDEGTRRERLPLKKHSQSSVSTTPSCLVVWVPWRLWIEHMSTAEFRFQCVNPLRQLRKIWKRTTKSSNGTNGSKTEHGNNTVPESTATPRQSTTVSGETAANPGTSTSDQESTDKTFGKEGQDKNNERPEAPVEDQRVEVAVLPGGSTSDKASTDNTESIQVEGVENNQNTTKNHQNRTAVRSFVQIFPNAKLRWNNPLKKTAPWDDLKRNGSEDHQVVPGSLEGDKTGDIQETPVIASSHGVELKGEREDPGNNPGTSTHTAQAVCGQEETQDHANNPGTKTDTAPAACDQSEAQDHANNPGTSTHTAQAACGQDETQDHANNPGTRTDTAPAACDQGEAQNPLEAPGTSTSSAPAANSQVPLTTPAQRYKPAEQLVRAWEMAGADTELSTSNRVYGLTTRNSYTPAFLFLASNQQQPNPANPSSPKTPLSDCGVPSGEPSSSSEPTALFLATRQSQPRQTSSKKPSTVCRVAPEVPSTEPSKENSNKRKKFSLFRPKSKQTHQEAESKPGRFSRQKNSIRPL